MNTYGNLTRQTTLPLPAFISFDGKNGHQAINWTARFVCSVCKRSEHNSNDAYGSFGLHDTRNDNMKAAEASAYAHVIMFHS